VRQLAELATSAGALLVMDEAQTGFGRTGKWFCTEHYGIQPDILVVSKGAGAGYPASAVTVSERVAERLVEAGFTHLSSHQNDPLTAAAVLGLVESIRAEGLVECAAATGERFLDRLRALQAAHPEQICDVRGRGLMIGFELADPGNGGEGPASLFGRLCAKRGVHVTYTYDGLTVRIIPPLILGDREIEHAIQVFDDVLGCIRARRFDDQEGIPTNACARTLLAQWNARFPWRRYLRRMWNTTPAEWAARLKGRGTEGGH
jgi:4-aminobutyrate aminotransferase-like enzyme